MKIRSSFRVAVACVVSAVTISNQVRGESWERLADGPGGRAYHSTAFTGDEVIVWGGGRDGQFLADGGALDVRTKAWRRLSTQQAPSGRWFHTAAWTGREMLVWGGRGSFYFSAHRTDGGRYDPRNNSWRSMNTSNAPSPRSQFAAVWTGSELIVWGGLSDDARYLADGGRYNPQTDTWRPIAPAPLRPRFEPTAVWTGTEMIVFGGLTISNYLGPEVWNSYGDGARYDPATDSWKVLNPQGAPSSRTVHSAVWTGKEMLIWGGRYLPSITYPIEGAGYDPTTDSWTPMSTRGTPAGRAGHAAVWTGREMIIWGGWTGMNNVEMNSGATYNPRTRIWTPITMAGAPEARFFNVPNAAVWTGSAMFIYGGFDYPISLNSAYLYDPDRIAAAIVALLEQVETLETPKRTERPLTAALEAALRSLRHGQEHAALNQLRAFQRKVERQLEGDTAKALIAAAQAIIDALSVH